MKVYKNLVKKNLKIYIKIKIGIVITYIFQANLNIKKAIFIKK